eukprot:TRINITY_DN6926_c0_g1_i1.p1 TRINITY_DN6926_c0_g1~~TRINITY_DN6926_c0_g1_i1.p1  ORF type:complete len:213 (-),score=44.45 TRINITY_DN6926_c0_g1_i1:170-808(-)
MLIASSYADLKSGLGNEHFLEDYPISSKEECTFDAYTKHMADTNEELVMTWEEKEEKEAAYESASTEKHVSAMVGVDVPIDEKGIQALEDFQAEKLNTIIFALDYEKEELGVEALEDNLTIEEIVKKLPSREPRYVLHEFSHEHEKATKKNIFIYYCPDKSKPKLRMFYSTAKQNVLSSIEEQKISEPKRIEISLASELTTQFLMDELYPKI